MTTNPFYLRFINIFKLILLVAFLAGLSEVLWIAFYAWMKHISLHEIAWQVVASINPTVSFSTKAVVWGVVIHFFLAIVISSVFILIIWPAFKAHAKPIIVLTTTGVALSCIWGLNFLLLLPHLNPQIMALLPLWVTFVSKTLFAVSLGCGVLYFAPKLMDKKLQ